MPGWRTLILLAALWALLLTATTGAAHTLFIKPQSFFFASGQPVAIPLFNGTFVLSENKVITSRMTGVAIVTPDGEQLVPLDTDWGHDGDTTVLSTRLDAPGTYLIGVGTRPTMAHITAADFNEYLLYEGLTDDAEERNSLQEDDVGAAERYAKFAKAIVQVDGKQTQNYSTVLGHPIEIVPLVNPYNVGKGGRFRARILKGGQPLANELVFATHEGVYELNAEGRYEELVTMRSDQDGIVEFELTETGRWYVRLIYLTRTGDSEFWYSNLLVWLGLQERRIPYDSLWATLTFEVQ